MIILKTEVGNFGPFNVVEEIEGGHLADGIFYPTEQVGLVTWSNQLPEIIMIPTVPEQVPMLNARTVLFRHGWLGPWEALLQAMPSPDGDLARIKWASALNVRRNDPLVILAVQGLGKTAEEADALFIEAAALEI